jgi:hypothetical protein
VVETKHPLLVIIAEEFGIASPVDGSPQGLLGIALVQMVLELELEPRPGSLVLLTLIQNMPDMGGERHKADQMFSE